MDVRKEKNRIRKQIWDRLEKKDIAAFPRPVYGRIPNFVGASDAADNLTEVEEFKMAKMLKVNPDAPQRYVRHKSLLSKKLLVMPPPRLRSELMLLDPAAIPNKSLYKASSISGGFSFGKSLSLREKFKVDFIVMGSVAVSRNGARVGKGEGYAELEYAILKTIAAIDDEVPIATTVHEVQLVDKIPTEDHDVPLDIIVTPKRVIRTKTRLKKPKGIIWDKITDEMLSKMPILRELKKK